MENNIASSLGIVPTKPFADPNGPIPSPQPEFTGKPQPASHFQAGRRQMTAREIRRARKADRSSRVGKQQKSAVKRQMKQQQLVGDAAQIGRIYFREIEVRDTMFRQIAARIDKQVKAIVAAEGIEPGEALTRVESSLRSAIQLDNLRANQRASAHKVRKPDPSRVVDWDIDNNLPMDVSRRIQAEREVQG